MRKQLRCILLAWIGLSVALIAEAIAQERPVSKTNVSQSSAEAPKRIVLVSLGILGHAVPLARLGAELAFLCCSRNQASCIIDFASHTDARDWWIEETGTVRESRCLGTFIDLGPLPTDWSEKLDRSSKDPSLFRSTLSVFTDLYLEAVPAMYTTMREVLQNVSLAVVDVGTVGAIERARTMNIPLVIHSPTIWADTFSQFEPPHWLPAFGSGFSKEMSLTERCLNALLPRLLSVALQPALMRVNKARFEAGLDPYQSSHQVFQDVRTISSTSFGFEYSRLSPILHAYVGPILPRRGNRPNLLRKGLRDFLSGCMKNSRNKLVIVRFGSMIRLDPKSVKAFEKGLRWIATKETICSVWFPSVKPRRVRPKRIKRKSNSRVYHLQSFDVDVYMTLLRMASTVEDFNSVPRTALSISSCGMAAVQEPLHYGIPVLCVPLVADQADVAARLKDSGAGVVLTKEAISADEVLFAANRLLNDQTVQKNARAVAAAFRLAGGRERAAQHVLSAFYPGDHLLLKKSLAWQKRVSLDVSIVYASMFVTVSMVLFLWLRLQVKRKYGF